MLYSIPLDGTRNGDGYHCEKTPYGSSGRQKKMVAVEEAEEDDDMVENDGTVMRVVREQLSIR